MKDSDLDFRIYNGLTVLTEKIPEGYKSCKPDVLKEEVKKLADYIGYSLIPKKKYVKVVPCKLCGHKGTQEWHCREGIKLRCSYCGNGSSEFSKNYNEAKLEWNRYNTEVLR